jgi:RNA polymerase sigma factor (sigma-70 family)
MTENDIITRLRQSDPSIFQWLYKEYYVALCTYAKKFTRDSQSAEEVVQDAFLKIWENRETLIIRESLIAYLYRTVQNNCLNYLRHLQVINKFNEYYTEKLHEAEELALLRRPGYRFLLPMSLKTRFIKLLKNCLPNAAKYLN